MHACTPHMGDNAAFGGAECDEIPWEAIPSAEVEGEDDNSRAGCVAIPDGMRSDLASFCTSVG